MLRVPCHRFAQVRRSSAVQGPAVPSRFRSVHRYSIAERGCSLLSPFAAIPCRRSSMPSLIRSLPLHSASKPLRIYALPSRGNAVPSRFESGLCLYFALLSAQCPRNARICRSRTKLFLRNRARCIPVPSPCFPRNAFPWRWLAVLRPCNSRLCPRNAEHTRAVPLRRIS